MERKEERKKSMQKSWGERGREKVLNILCFRFVVYSWPSVSEVYHFILLQESRPECEKSQKIDMMWMPLTFSSQEGLSEDVQEKLGGGNGTWGHWQRFKETRKKGVCLTGFYHQQCLSIFLSWPLAPWESHSCCIFSISDDRWEKLLHEPWTDKLLNAHLLEISGLSHIWP